MDIKRHQRAEDIDGFASAANSQLSQASIWKLIAIRRLRRLLARPPAVSSLRSQSLLGFYSLWFSIHFGEFSKCDLLTKKKEQKAINVFAAEYQFFFCKDNATSANCHDKSQTTSFFCIFAQLAAVTERQKQGLLQYQKWSRRWKVLCLISPHLTF